MTAELAKQIVEAALDRLMTALEEGQSAVLKRYLAVMSRFRRYRGNGGVHGAQQENARSAGKLPRTANPGSETTNKRRRVRW